MLQHGEKRHSADTDSGAAPRVKPALLAKPILPINIQRKVIVAPGSTGGVGAINSGIATGSKVKLIQKNFTTAKSLDGGGESFDSRRHLPNKLSEEQLRLGLEALGGGASGNVSTTQTMSTSSPLKNIPTKKLPESAGKKATPSSPNLGGCTNDCCGIILNSNSSHKQQSLQSSKNGTDCSLSSAGTAATNSAYQGVKSCFSNHEPKSYGRKLEDSRIKSSSDSVDSSLSSSSGGFKDPDFITRQTMAFELYKNREPGISSTTSNICITKPPQHIQSISQYQKSSKQLEQMLAQRLEKSLALGSGPSASVVAGSQPPPIAPHHLRARSIDTSIGSSLSTVGSGNVSGSGAGTGAGGCFLGSSTIPKQIQQKLQEEMKMQCKNIKEKFLIEKRHPQEHYKPAYRETKIAQATPDGKTAPKPKNDASTNSTDDPSLNDENCLVYRDGNLISGTLETLIKHMVPTDEYYPDQSYLFAFLLSTRLFIKPHELLQQVCDICHHQQQLGVYLSNNNNNGVANQQKAQSLSRFACNFVQLLSEWIETFPYDFRDERVMQHVRLMTQKCINIDSKLRTEVSTLLQNLLQRLKTLEKYEEFLDKINVEGSKECDIKSGGGRADSRSSSNSFHQSTEKSSSSIHHHTSSSTSSVNSISSISSTLSTPDITDLCPSPSVLAHQLTHIELERLSYIGPEEFVQAFAKENPNVDTSIKDMKKTRNLESYVQWFNRLSYIVATEICKHSKKKQRARVIEYWIETARESFNIGNFNTLMAIIAGLNMSPIARLKKTWAKIQSAKFSILEHQMDPTSNFSSYRSTLKAAMWRSEGATDERQRIVIPFFSLLVKDLYFLNEGCSNKLPNGHINFEKFWQLAKQVNEFIGWKQVSCPYEKNPKIIMFLQTNSILNENTLAMASFDCEPPENSAEKDRYKSLKHEHYNN